MDHSFFAVTFYKSAALWSSPLSRDKKINQFSHDFRFIWLGRISDHRKNFVETNFMVFPWFMTNACTKQRKVVGMSVWIVCENREGSVIIWQPPIKLQKIFDFFVKYCGRLCVGFFSSDTCSFFMVVWKSLFWRHL